MSFSSEIKEELCSVQTERDCCQRAQSYGILFFARHFSKNRIGILTDYKCIADVYADDVYYLTGFRPDAEQTASGKLRVDVNKSGDVVQILNSLGYSGGEVIFKFLEENIENDCCPAAFLRGAFLACGVASDPKSGYHIEFSTGNAKKSSVLSEMLSRCGFNPHVSNRKGAFIVYMKTVQDISDFLGLIGSQRAALELIDTELVNSVRNNVNRKTNCENANMKKTCMSSLKQVHAINALKENGRFDSLPESDKTLAKLRIDNPEMTLQELGEMLDPPLSRSGVYHRLNKMLKLAGGKNDV